jgi:hypothetical protein
MRIFEYSEIYAAIKNNITKIDDINFQKLKFIIIDIYSDNHLEIFSN